MRHAPAGRPQGSPGKIELRLALASRVDRKIRLRVDLSCESGRSGHEVRRVEPAAAPPVEPAAWAELLDPAEGRLWTEGHLGRGGTLHLSAWLDVPAGVAATSLRSRASAA